MENWISIFERKKTEVVSPYQLKQHPESKLSHYMTDNTSKPSHVWDNKCAINTVLKSKESKYMCVHLQTALENFFCKEVGHGQRVRNVNRRHQGYWNQTIYATFTVWSKVPVCWIICLPTSFISLYLKKHQEEWPYWKIMSTRRSLIQGKWSVKNLKMSPTSSYMNRGERLPEASQGENFVE